MSSHSICPALINLSQIACLTADFFYYFSSYLVDGYFSSWVYVIVDWNVSACLEFDKKSN